MVQAEPQQYGFLSTLTELNCSTTLDQLTFLVIITWFKEVGKSKIILGRQAQFSNTAISDEASYVCEVDITEMDIVIERRIDFKVIGRFAQNLLNKQLNVYWNFQFHQESFMKKNNWNSLEIPDKKSSFHFRADS